MLFGESSGYSAAGHVPHLGSKRTPNTLPAASSHGSNFKPVTGGTALYAREKVLVLGKGTLKKTERNNPDSPGL